MRTVAIIFILSAVGACTKPNPNRCCVDEADCQANNIPVGSTCQDGLVCRGNQCIAESCTSAAQCDSSAPYCVAGLCGSTCMDDSECPGATQDPTDMFCVGGGCVQCRVGMADCPSTAPICDANSCRGCRANSECSSQLCDLDSGACVDASTITYASPTGPATALCTLSDPCSFDRAFQVATNDPVRATIKLAAGTYGTTAWILSSGTLTIYGDGQATTSILDTRSTGGTLRLRDVAVTLNGIQSAPATAGGQRPTVDLDRVTCLGDMCIDANPAIVAVRHSTIDCGTGSCTNGPILLGGNSSVVNGGSELTVDQSVIKGGNSGSFAIGSYSGSSFTIRNSVVIGHGASFQLFNAQMPVSSSIAFSTLYDVLLGCGTASGATPWLASNSNIFLVTALGAPADTASGNLCSHNYDLIMPQSTNPGGAGNILNMDPKLKSPDIGDFHPLSGSPAIDSADPAATSDTYDYDGTSRPQGARNDIGAFEYH